MHETNNEDTFELAFENAKISAPLREFAYYWYENAQRNGIYMTKGKWRITELCKLTK